MSADSRSYWLKQTKDKPLFPDLIWSRPENKRTAGKLLIVGGQAQGFASVAEAYDAALKAGIGSARVILPDSLLKTVSQLFPVAEYAPSNPSGAFSNQALANIIDASQWADGVLWPGDLGRNSETAILLERFIKEYDGALCLSNDSLEYFIKSPASLLKRPASLVVVNLSQLQKLATATSQPKAVTTSTDLLGLVEWLHGFTKVYSVPIIVIKDTTVFVSYKGQVSTTLNQADITSLASAAIVWQIQNPSKIFESLSSAVSQV